MTRPHRFFSFFLLTLLLAGTASADDASRAGRLISLTGESPGVWLSSDRIYSSGGSFLSACAAGRGCAPVLDQESCLSPECPGAGTVYRVSHGVADVGGWPTDHDGYQRELEALRATPALAAVGLSDHPEHAERQRRHDEDAANDQRNDQRRGEDVRWVNRYREGGPRFELALDGSLATLTEAGGTYMGGMASLSVVHLLDADDAADDDSDSVVLNIFFGDVFGAELRTHFLYRVDTAQEAEWITAVGLTAVLENRFQDSVVRIPTYFGTIVPEIGMILRADRDPTWYVAWDAPFSFLIDHDLAFDVAARVFLIDDWINLPDDAPEDAEEPAEVILMLNMGFRLP